MAGRLDIFSTEHVWRNDGNIVPEALLLQLFPVSPAQEKVAVHEIEIKVLCPCQPALVEDHFAHIIEPANIRLSPLAAKLQFHILTPYQ